MYAEGDSVTYAGNLAEVRGMVGKVKGPGASPGRVMVEWSALGTVVDMSDSVLHAANKPEGSAMTEYSKVQRKTVVTHPDGTQSTRKSATMVYTHAVEQREDMWATAKTLYAKAQERRDAKAKFIEAVRGGRVKVDRSKFARTNNVYVVHEDGEEYWLGAGSEAEPVDRKAGVRWKLERYDEQIAQYEGEAREAESGPQYRYGVVRWSQSEVNARNGLDEFARRFSGTPTKTFRLLPVDGQ